MLYMKKLTFSLFLYFILPTVIYAQNYNWITPNQIYLKMYITTDGIYRIGKVDFTNAGISTGTIDPRTVKVLYKGAQIPICFAGEQDGIFNDTDYFDFYGRKNYGGLTNSYNQNNQVLYTTDENFDLYSDTSAYWISWGGANGLRFSDYGFNSLTNYNLDYYYVKLRFEKDLVYSLGETYDANSDYRYFNTEKCQGEGWYWKLMNWQNSVSDTSSTQLKSTTNQTCYFKVFAYPSNYSSSIQNEHRLTIKINNTLVDTLKSDDFNRIDTTITFPSSYLSSSSFNNFVAQYTPPSSFSSGQMYFDFMEIRYPHRFIFDNNTVSFNTNSSDTVSKVFRIKGYTAANEISIYDIKNNYRITNYTASADTLVFTGKGNGSFEVTNKTITRKPARIKQKQVPYLVSAANGADYLLVYNKLFETQAEQLRQYRASHDTLRSVKAEIEDIYDVFNYGMENPVALKNFTKYVYENWQAPKVHYLCLFGRSSLDPKKNLSLSVYYKNYIPVYGNPPSDGYFVNFNTGTFNYVQQVSVGRLPVYTVQEAQDVVNKIMGYETQPLDRWIKFPTFISGGFGADEQQAYSVQSDNLIGNYVTPPPFSTEPIKIYRKDSTGYLTFNYPDSIKKTINGGTIFVNYIGHAATATWDAGLEDPTVLSNGLKLPLVMSMTCFTGRNSIADSRGFAETFINSANKGCIGLIGSTGWSFSQTGFSYNTYIIKGFSEDSTKLRRLGDLLRYSSYQLNINNDSTNFATRNTINSYILLGDPATRLLFPSNPEFDIQQSDYSLSNQFPQIRENISLNVSPKNIGTFADSCKIRFQILKNGLNYRTKDTVVRNFGYTRKVRYDFNLDSSASYLVKITLDPDNWYAADLKTNNILSFPLTLSNIAFAPLKPLDNMLITKDTVDITALNPGLSPLKNNIKLLLQVDTARTFYSPAMLSFFRNGFSGVQTVFKTALPFSDTNIVYYWRTNAVINGDSTGWTSPRRFTYNPSASLASKEFSRINTPADSFVTILKKNVNQFNISELSGVDIDSSGLVLSKYQGSIIARSHGENGWDASYFLINNFGYYLLGNSFYGINIAKVRKIDATLLEIRNFKLNSPSNSDSIVNFLNTFDSTHIMMLVKGIPFGVTDSLRLNARNKIKEFGSIYVDSAKTCRGWDKWSFISYSKSPNLVTSEGFLKWDNVNWLPVTSSLTPVFQNRAGNVTQTFGPAQRWKGLITGQVLYPGSDVKLDIIGINRSEQEVPLHQNITPGVYINLDTMNAYQYPKIKLIAKMSIDSVSGTYSPVLKTTKVNYIPPPELALDVNSIYLSDTIARAGDSIKAFVNYYNVGYRDSYGAVVNWYIYKFGQKMFLKTDTLYNILKVDSMRATVNRIKLSYFGNYKKTNDLVNINYEIIPLPGQNDIYDFNNNASTNIYIKSGTGDTKSIRVYADGSLLQGGEYVRLKPEMTLKISNQGDARNESKRAYRDTAEVRVYVNSKYFTLSGDNRNTSNVKPDAENNKTVIFHPALNDGQNRLKFVYRNNDEGFDTLSLDVTVSSELSIKDLSNYPNPMRRNTSFMFNLSGSEHPASCKIKIFTVSGRLVKVINNPAVIGYNQVPWDGTDEDGDLMANGVYLYKLIIEGDSQKETSIQKLVILK